MVCLQAINRWICHHPTCGIAAQIGLALLLIPCVLIGLLVSGCAGLGWVVLNLEASQTQCVRDIQPALWAMAAPVLLYWLGAILIDFNVFGLDRLARGMVGPQPLDHELFGLMFFGAAASVLSVLMFSVAHKHPASSFPNSGSLPNPSCSSD